MPAYVIGIDIGTGSAKAVAISGSKEVLATAQHHYATVRTQGFAEQDPQAIWQAFAQCLADVVSTMRTAPAMVSLSSCMHSLLAVDEKGHPITPMINWADARSQAIAESLRQSAGAEALYKATGTPLHSMSPLSKIIWFRQKEKETFLKAAKWISIKEFIWYRLFGVYEVDSSIAAATGLLQLETLAWYAPALSLAGIGKDQLSQVQPTHYVRSGLTAAAVKELHLATNTPFCIGASDGCLANLGTGALDKGIAALTIGTSGAVRVATPLPVLHYEAMLFNYPLDEHTFICGGPVNNGGNVVQWALTKMQQLPQPGQKDYEAFYAQLGAIPAGSSGLICLPYFIGERAPVWDERSSGVFIGVRPHHTPAHFFRAALEGVCFALFDVLQQVEAATGPVHQLNVSGGFIRSGVWLQMLADISGKNLVVTGTEDASAMGATLLALRQLGWIGEAQLHRLPAVEKIAPRPQKQALYSQLFAVYKTLYPSLKNAMHQLYQLQS